MYSYFLCFQSYTCCPLGGALVLWCQRSFILPHICCWLHGYTLLQQLTAGRETTQTAVFGLPLGTADGLSVPSGRTSIFSYPSSSWWSHRTGWREIENGCVVWFRNVTHFHFLFLALSMAFLSRWRTELSCTAVLDLAGIMRTIPKPCFWGTHFLGNLHKMATTW